MNSPTDYIYVPIKAEIYAELIKRSGTSNVNQYIEGQIVSFLEATEGDADIWCPTYIESYAEQQDQNFLEKFGQATRGYQWQNLFLPNGTKLRMTYRRETHHAEIQHQALVYSGEKLSPSEFARKVANNTNRNAWRDIFIQFIGDKSWRLADELRREKLASLETDN